MIGLAANTGIQPNTRCNLVETDSIRWAKKAFEAKPTSATAHMAALSAVNWSARVMFHDDVYAGRWWETANKEHGGTSNGTITRTP